MRHLLLILFCGISLSLTAHSVADEREINKGETLANSGETARSLLIINKYIDTHADKCMSRADSVLLLRALNINADNYHNLGNIEQALVYYLRAIDISKKTGEHKRLAKLYNSVFGIYYTKHEYDRAEDLLKMSLEINIAINDSVAIRSNYNNFGLVYYERGKYKQAFDYSEKAIAYTPKHDRVGLSLIYTNRGEFYYKQGLYSKAERELQIALNIQRGCKFNPQMVLTSLNTALVKAHLGKRKEVAAMEQELYAKVAKQPLTMQSNSYQELAEIHFVVGDSLAALRDILKYHIVDDSLKKTSNNSQLQQLLIAYDAERLKQHNDNLQQTVNLYRLKVSNRTIMIYVVVTFLAILAVLLAVLIRHMRIDKKNNRLIHDQQQRLLAYEQQEHLRRQHELTQEIDHKNRQLTSYTLDLATINEFHQRISDSLQAIRTQLDENDKPDVVDEQLASAVSSLKHFNDKPLGNDFHTYFDEVHPGFLQRLEQQYHLSKTDLRLCAYLHLGMTTKEIAALTFKEVRSVESSRNRLRKKLGLPPESNLQDFLLRFSAKDNNV